MFMNQNRRSFFLLLIMIFTLVFFFVYIFIPKSEKKNINQQRLVSILPGYIEGFYEGFRKNIQFEISKIFKKQMGLFDIEFIEYGLFSNTIKKYPKVEMEVFTLFDINFSVLSKMKVRPEWIKNLLKKNDGESIALVNLEIMSERFIINRIAYNNNGDVVFIIFGNKLKNTGFISKIFNNVISFKKKDLIYRFKLIKLGNKIKEICYD